MWFAGRSPCKSARGGDRLPAQEPLVNEFAWPAASRPIDFDVQSHQGYILCGWNRAGLNYVIISELSEAEMERFEDLLREQTD